MKLKALLMATALLLPIHSVFAETVDEYVAGLKKEASIGNTEAQKELDQFQDLTKKANAGDATAQYELAMFYKAKSDSSSSKSKNVYVQEQEKWLLKAANQGNSAAQRGLVSLYSGKSQFTSDAVLKKKVEDLLIQLAKKGDPKDQYMLGFYYADSNDKALNKKAGEWFQKAADQGNVPSLVNIGKGYLYGDYGIEKNYNKAKEIFEKLADQQYIMGFYYLAICYQNGYGVPKDVKKAIELYEVAADNDTIAASVILSKVYMNGINNVVSPNEGKFWKYYNQVCSNKRSMVCIRLMSEIAGDCVEKYGNNTEFLEPNSNKDPICKAIVTQSLR